MGEYRMFLIINAKTRYGSRETSAISRTINDSVALQGRLYISFHTTQIASSIKILKYGAVCQNIGHITSFSNAEINPMEISAYCRFGFKTIGFVKNLKFKQGIIPLY